MNWCVLVVPLACFLHNESEDVSVIVHVAHPWSPSPLTAVVQGIAGERVQLHSGGVCACV